MPRKTPSKTAYATTSAGFAIREKETTSPSTRPMIIEPIQTGMVSAAGTMIQASAAIRPVMPSRVTVLTTTSSMVIGATAGGAAG